MIRPLLLCLSFLPLAAVSGNAQERSGAAPASGESGRLAAFTIPSRKATLAFTQSGRIAAILAREGAVVRAGDALVRLDDRVQRERCAIAALRAESDLEIKLAHVRFQHASDELDRLRSLGRSDLATEKELRQAEATLAAQKLEWEIAKSQREEAHCDLALQQALLNDHAALAPFDGYVSERLKEVGETVEARDGIVTVVALDPLEVLLECPLDAAQRIAPGAILRIVPALDACEPRDGTVERVNRVAGAASQTVRIRILVPNPRHDWIAGMRVNVELPAAGTQSAASGDAAAHGVAAAGREEQRP